jgi:hypothetical protein
VVKGICIVAGLLILALLPWLLSRRGGTGGNGLSGSDGSGGVGTDGGWHSHHDSGHDGGHGGGDGGGSH